MKRTTQQKNSLPHPHLRSSLYKLCFVATAGTCFLGCFETDMLVSDNPKINAGTSSQAIEHDGETREFMMYVPSSYDGSTELPVLFNFHGFGGTAQDFMSETNMRSLAEQENFILVYPQGSALDGYPHWNSSLPSADNKSSADDFGFFEAMLNDISANYAIDADRVYASGYSNGGFFAYSLACYHSDLVAAIGSVSGTMTEDVIQDCNPSHPTAVINIHGTEDSVLPYNGGSGYSSVNSVMNYWIDFNQTSSTATTDSVNGIDHYVYDNGEGDVTLEHYRVNGGGHVWFDLDYNGATTGELIWEFVSRYDRNGQREPVQ